MSFESITVIHPWPPFTRIAIDVVKRSPLAPRLMAIPGEVLVPATDADWHGELVEGRYEAPPEEAAPAA